MKNKKAAVAVIVFAVIFMVFAAIMAFSGHIPFIGKGFSLIVAILMIIFVTVFFIIVTLTGRKK